MLESDPVTLACDETGDLIIVNGRFSLVSGLDAFVVGARTRMQLIAGEWFLDLNAGVPWLENQNVSAQRALLGSRFNATRLRTEMRKAILKTPGAQEVTKLDVSFDTRTRTASVTWRARAIFGDTDLDVLEVTT